MSRKTENANSRPAIDDAPSPPAPRKHHARRSLRRFFLFLLIVVLICGIYVLATNGVYYWYSQPILKTYQTVSGTLHDGLPATATSQADRLAFYASCDSQLRNLPDQLATLNRQPWAFAVLIRSDLTETIPELLDRATRGQAAVKAYFAAIQAIEAEMEAFRSLNGEPSGENLTERLAWYSARVEAVDRLETLYAGLASIPDGELAGSFTTRSELGLDEAAAEVDAYRQPVIGLQALLDQSSSLEQRLDQLYAQDPGPDGLAAARTACGEMLAQQNSLIASAAALRDKLPQPLQTVFDTWRTGLDGRSNFITNMQAWWTNSTLVAQSIESARTDRATAKRYIADSLAEKNVETAYLWTKTAEQYQSSMNTAIDFANIYIGRLNETVSLMAAARPLYRAALELPENARVIAEALPIDPEAFWLEGS
jgi:hypothetical protein